MGVAAFAANAATGNDFVRGGKASIWREHAQGYAGGDPRVAAGRRPFEALTLASVTESAKVCPVVEKHHGY
jgi:hypothetical protein